MPIPWLSLLTFLPLLGFGLVMLSPKGQNGLHRALALGISTVVLLISLVPLMGFQKIADMQFVEKAPLIAGWGIQYYLGIDGISLFLVLLVTLLTPIVVLSSFRQIEKHPREYYALLLLLETGMVGALVALDVVLFYVFWELMLIPMFFIIGIWGGPRRIYATVKFVLFTLAGSLLMLVAILYMAWKVKNQIGVFSFALEDFYRLSLTFSEQVLLFGAFALAFAVKVPLFPLHTWLPDAHVEAPTGGSVILAGVLLKMGTYGFMRFALPLFPAASHAFAPLFIALSIIGIIYGAFMALVQDDVKKLVAYSSVSHLGYVMLGLFTFSVTGLQGGLYQMLNHGLSTGSLFLIIGMLYERRHTRLISDFGGLTKVVPLLAVVFMITTLSSIGLPGLNGFVGEFLILLAAFQTAPLYAALAATGVVLGAVYMLWMFQRVMFGPVTHAENKALKDLSAREIILLLPILFLMFFMGVFPNPILSRTEKSVEKLARQIAAAPSAKVQIAEVPGETIHERQ